MNTNDGSDREFLAAIASYRSLLKHRLVLLDSLSQGDFDAISTGIIFVFATWSGPARIALHTIAKLLEEARFCAVWLDVVSIDKMDLGPEVFGNVRFGGFGETLWLRKGQIVYTGSAYDERDLADLTIATETLLKAPTEIFDKTLAHRTGV